VDCVDGPTDPELSREIGIDLEVDRLLLYSVPLSPGSQPEEWMMINIDRPGFQQYRDVVLN